MVVAWDDGTETFELSGNVEPDVTQQEQEPRT